jgi:transposase-like protein
MDYSNFVVLLARQRSGTNVLRSILDTHPEVFCAPEVFNNRMDTDYLIGGRKHGGAAYVNPSELSYFNFLDKYAKGDIKKVLLPDDHENIFLDFLEYLRCFTSKQVLVLDVKYMSTHHITKNWHFITEEPFFFSLLKEHNLRVLNLTRKNFLRYWLSELKAQQSRVWQEFDESVVGDKPWYTERKNSRMQRQESKIYVDIDELLETLRLCHSENKVVEDSFSEYEHYLTFDYDDLFAYIGAPLSPLVLKRFAQWAGIDNSFAAKRPEYKKLSHLTLEETIENYEAVVQALRGTEFEYCLEDEGLYLNVPATSATKPDRL